jgi:flavin-dependent dehydrogenase
MSREPDIVVVGGGPAGLAAAIASARAGADVMVFERGHQRQKPGEILEPTIKYPLRDLGLWDQFVELGFLPIAGNLSVWDDTEPAEAEGMLNPHGHGYLVDRTRMEAWLIDQARRAGVRVLTGERRIALADAGSRRLAWLDGERRVEAQPGLIIDATGRGRGVIEGTRRRVDQLVALLAYVPDRACAARDQRIYIEAMPDGWWYSAPLPGSVTVFAFMTDADLLPPGAAAREAFFRCRLAASRITRQRRPAIPHACRVRAHPANSSRRATVSGRGWVAVGDAAATYDPLSGFGVTAALTKGTALARLIANSATIGQAMSLYGAAEDAAYADYLHDRRGTYSRVARWRSERFWARRSS